MSGRRCHQRRYRERWRRLAKGGGGRETAVHDMKRKPSGMMGGAHVGAALSPAPLPGAKGGAWRKVAAVVRPPCMT